MNKLFKYFSNKKGGWFSNDKFESQELKEIAEIEDI